MTKYKVVSFVLSEVPRLKKGDILETGVAKSAPPYSGAIVPAQFIASQTYFDLQGHSASLTLKTHEPDILLAEVSFEVQDIFADEIFTLKEHAIDEAIAALKKKGAKNTDKFSEEYTVYVMYDYEGSIDENFLAHKNKIASLLKSEQLKLDENEIQYTLSSSIKYEHNDLVMVDWDGAFIYSPKNDFDATIKLFQLANAQLLQYRLLDRALDQRFDTAIKLVKKLPERPNLFKALFRAKDLDKGFKEVISLHAQSISDFEDLDRDVKLIGDWYSARLYELLVKKFKLEDWRRAIKDKLESLEDVYTIASENLGISRAQILELIQIWLFFILQIGWFALIILEFLYFTRK